MTLNQAKEIVRDVCIPEGKIVYCKHNSKRMQRLEKKLKKHLGKNFVKVDFFGYGKRSVIPVVVYPDDYDYLKWILFDTETQTIRAT